MLIKTVESTKEMNDALLVRKTVFVEEQKVPAELEIDQYEQEAVHFVAYDQVNPVAAGRFRKLNGAAKVERVCVLREYRKTGLGKHLMQAIEKRASQLNLDSLKLNAQITAVGFYHKLGYEVVSEEFIDAGIPHVTMKKSL